MFQHIYNDIIKLEQAFSGKSKNVLLAVERLQEKFKISNKEEILKNGYSKKDFNKIISTIEKLSIQCDYKISLLKDFSKYINNKKQL